MTTNTCRIRALNDSFRRSLNGGKAVMTPGIASLGPEVVNAIVRAVASFDAFCTANDSHAEHDFGALDLDGQKVFFKIDYYDRNLRSHSPDPADATVTQRVITLMLAHEY